MDVGSAWKAIRTRWLIVVGVTALLGVLAGILTIVRPPLYTATAEGLVSISHPQTRPPWSLTNGSQYITDRMTSYAQLGCTTSVILPVYARLHLHETLSGRIGCEWMRDKALLHITATYSDPTEAAHIADGILQQLGATIERIENGNVVVTAVTPATPPTAPSNQDVVLNVGVAGVAGLVLGLVGAVGLQLISDRSRRRPAGRRWVIDTNVYTSLCRAGHASLIPQLAPDDLVLVPTDVDAQIEKERARYPEVPSVASVGWAEKAALTKEEVWTQIQVKARMGGAVNQYLPECAVIAAASHRDLTAVLGEDVAIEEAQRLGVRTCSFMGLVIEAYDIVFDRNRGPAAALVDDLLAAGVQLPFDSGESLFTWVRREGLLPDTYGAAR